MSSPWEGFASSSASNYYDYMNMPSTSKQIYPPQPPYNMLQRLEAPRRAQQSTSTYTSVMQAREHHMAKVETWMCRLCLKEFKSKSGLSCHFTLMHTAKQPAQEMTAMLPYSPMGHAHAQAAPYSENTPSSKQTCNICGKELASRSSLLRHVKSAHETAPKTTKTIIKNRVSQKNTNVTINVYQAEYKKKQH